MKHPLTIPQSMIPAVLDGTKTQHRVPLDPQPGLFSSVHSQKQGDWRIYWTTYIDGSPKEWLHLPFAIGDELWVREEWWQGDYNFRPDAVDPPEIPEPALFYRSNRARDVEWQPADTMPEWASRITLTVTDLRVEQDADGLWCAVPTFEVKK